MYALSFGKRLKIRMRTNLTQIVYPSARKGTRLKRLNAIRQMQTLTARTARQMGE